MRTGRPGRDRGVYGSRPGKFQGLSRAPPPGYGMRRPARLAVNREGASPGDRRPGGRRRINITPPRVPVNADDPPVRAWRGVRYADGAGARKCAPGKAISRAGSRKRPFRRASERGPGDRDRDEDRMKMEGWGDRGMGIGDRGIERSSVGDRNERRGAGDDDLRRPASFCRSRSPDPDRPTSRSVSIVRSAIRAGVSGGARCGWLRTGGWGPARG